MQAAALVLVMTLAPADASPQPDATRPQEAAIDDRGDLQGRWEEIAVWTGGRKASEEDIKEVEWTFRGDKVFYRRGATSVFLGDGRFRLEYSKDPPEIDFEDDGQPAERGVFRIRGDCLEITLTREGDRPAGFSPEQPQGTGLAVFRRVKK
jgi:uncharacterized protein (TIGR03067 family)